MFDWNSSYSVGIESIDKQHKKMFEIGKKIEHVIETFDGTDIEEVLRSTYSELITYTELHFSFEESLMKKSGFKGYEDHVKKHQMLLDKIHSLEITNSDNQGSTAFSVLQLIAEWIFEHIQGDDFAYINTLKRYLNE